MEWVFLKSQDITGETGEVSSTDYVDLFLKGFHCYDNACDAILWASSVDKSDYDTIAKVKTSGECYRGDGMEVWSKISITKSWAINWGDITNAALEAISLALWSDEIRQNRERHIDTIYDIARHGSALALLLVNKKEPSWRMALKVAQLAYICDERGTKKLINNLYRGERT